jgi:integrase
MDERSLKNINSEAAFCPCASVGVDIHLFGKFLGRNFRMARTVRNAKFDTRSARAKLPANKSGFWVPIARGFALGYRKGPKGGSWLARLIDSKGRHETTLGPADDVLGPDGERILDYAQAQASARSWLTTFDARGNPGPYTVNRCLDDYISDYKRRGGKALDRLEITTDAFIRPKLGSLEVAALAAAIIRQWQVEIAEAPPRLRTRTTGKLQNVREIDLEDRDALRRRRASANRIFGILKAALNLAFREGHAARDEAWRRVKPFREASAPKIRYLSHAEAQRLVNACDPGFRALVQCALLTGCRYGEITNFQVSEFDRDAGTVSVRISKAGRPRHVVLTDDGVALFERHVAGKVGTALVFTRSDGVRWGKSHQHRPLREACRHAQIDPPASFHILRHTYATHLLQAGAPLPVIAANLGHADTRMTERHYAHLVPSHVAQVIRATMPKLGLVEPALVVPLTLNFACANAVGE